MYTVSPSAMARSSYLINLLLGTWIALLCSLSLSAPLELDEKSVLVKRNNAVYDLWSTIPNTQKAQGDSALPFSIDQTRDNVWGVTYLYGCTALMISDPNFVIVAHIQQETGTGTICINDQIALQKYLRKTLQPALDLHDPTPNTQVDLIYNSLDCKWSSTGVQSIKSFLMDDANFGVAEDNIFPRAYTGSSGTGIPSPNSPRGLAVIQWKKPQLEGLTVGTLQVYFNSDTPLRDQIFVTMG
ncbi:hypothetical protein F4859DRAFT_109617 [Xylaria cf. heliscus]|nr:hypothetical protein F4859DRAFT_109617 [Xylaria cf. heliscus]